MEQLSRNYDLTNLTDYKDYMVELIDSDTETNIFSGFTFDNKRFSLSISAQINWSNLFNIPDVMFPLTLNCKDETTYSLELANRQNFYLTALSAKNTALQNGTVKKQMILTCTTINEIETVRQNLNI